ncbi:MAG: hypothetical protein B7Z45_10420 [Azorhizobium sp. 12-66-6]|nr:MAG: hypothetical protein B7Z45_10420 [Azorhizobium sp. 12-66-6]
MTLYLLFEQLEAGRLKLDSEMVVSSRAAAQSPSKLNVRAGSTIDVEDAIKAIVTRSANDVAVVIAETVGGTEERFADMMTRKAHALGMSRTNFENANGLPNPRQVTTARDLSILGRAIQERFPREYKYFSTRSFTYKGETIGNHNRLLGRVEGVDGIKTGYTRASGFNLLTSLHRDDRYLIGVVLGGSSGASPSGSSASSPCSRACVATAPSYRHSCKINSSADAQVNHSALHGPPAHQRRDTCFSPHFLTGTERRTSLTAPAQRVVCADGSYRPA